MRSDERTPYKKLGTQSSGLFVPQAYTDTHTHTHTHNNSRFPHNLFSTFFLIVSMKMGESGKLVLVSCIIAG